MVFQTQLSILLVILVIDIQDLYMTKYKYTINRRNIALFLLYAQGVSDRSVRLSLSTKKSENLEM